MSAGACSAKAGAVEEKKISNNLIAVLGIVGSLAGIYVASLFNFLAFVGGVAIILATLWGANGVRTVAKYGIGTGVPSVGMVALGGAVAAVFVGIYLTTKTVLLAPVVALVLALLTGLLIGISARYILKMNIPVMVRCMTEICGAGALLILAHVATITGSFELFYLRSISETGIIMMVFIVGALGILHPYNACLGADERQGRTLKLALATGSAQVVLAGIASLYFLGLPGIITILFGALAWFVTYSIFVKTSFEEGIVFNTGLIPEVEHK
ncbi:MAG: tetrahydromethanopterin S-methyltransferase subunit C [Archaeoglobales archaeon]|nr:tetrahydromethanopterin S-methyltransferase subunit C [Archaeoglobales archaeon]